MRHPTRTGVRLPASLRHVLLICTISLLPACSILQTSSQPPLDPELHQSRLMAMQCWELSAKIGIRTEAGAESARVHWIQSGESYQITLSGPLGVGAVRIEGDAEKVVMHTERNRMLMARSPEVLLREEFGWELPVSNLFYWIRGIAVPDQLVSSSTFNAEGLLIHLVQDQWTLDIDQHIHASDLLLPERVRLTHPDMQTKLIIKEWQPGYCE